MNITIQLSALADLRRGFRFYECQEADLGSYFLDSPFSDIDSLKLFAGIHPRHLSVASIACCPNDFPIPFIMKCETKGSSSVRCWTNGAIPNGSPLDLEDFHSPRLPPPPLFRILPVWRVS